MIVPVAARQGRKRRARSFLAGSVLGGLVVLVAPRARRRRALLPRGLAAFESAPCADARPDGTLPGRGPVADQAQG
jgi:hypothetical protein